jgi:hypothetical protein
MIYMPFALMPMPYFSEFMPLCFNAVSIQRDLPNARAKLRGLEIFGRAAVSSSLLLAGFSKRLQVIWS